MSVPRPAMLVATVTAPKRPRLGYDLRFFLVELGVEGPDGEFFGP